MRKVCFFALGVVYLLSLTGCQAYRSNGRNLFEAAAPGELSSTNAGSPPIVALEKPNSTSCWSQPKNDQLWFAQSGKEYRVKFIDEQSIEVCLEETKDSLSHN